MSDELTYMSAAGGSTYPQYAQQSNTQHVETYVMGVTPTWREMSGCGTGVPDLYYNPPSEKPREIAETLKAVQKEMYIKAMDTDPSLLPMETGNGKGREEWYSRVRVAVRHYNKESAQTIHSGQTESGTTVQFKISLKFREDLRDDGGDRLPLKLWGGDDAHPGVYSVEQGPTIALALTYINRWSKYPNEACGARARVASTAAYVFKTLGSEPMDLGTLGDYKPEMLENLDAFLDAGGVLPSASSQQPQEEDTQDEPGLSEAMGSLHM